MSLASTASSTDNYEEYSYYIHSDHLGSTSYITDSDGEVSQHVEYVPVIGIYEYLPSKKKHFHYHISVETRRFYLNL